MKKFETYQYTWRDITKLIEADLNITSETWEVEPGLDLDAVVVEVRVTEENSDGQ